MAIAPLPSHFRAAPLRRAVHAIPLAPPTPWAWPLLRLLMATLLAVAATGLFAQVAINTNGAPPAGNALLDLQSPNRGLLVPRMTSTQRVSLSNNAPGPFITTLDGLLVYQTDSVGQTPRGYYYYDASTPTIGWRHLAWGPDLWQLGGNAGTTVNDFLGTTNAMPLVFRTHSRDQGRITETGEFQLYPEGAMPATPSALVEVAGGVKLDGGSSAINNAGTIRYTPGSGNTPGKFEGYVVNTPGGDDHINGWKQIDNHFKERKTQQSPIAGTGCLPPSSASNPAATPRPWPNTGPGTYASNGGPLSPYYTVWEDGHRQYLYQGSELAAMGICPGATNPITAIAFNVTGVGGGSGRIHFLRLRIKNTANTTITGYDMGSLADFAYPAYPGGTPPAYAVNHLTGYTVINGWNVHAYDQVGPGFIWGGGNLLIDASLDNQEWSGPSIRSGSVQVYTSVAGSSIYMYCDACGGNGTTSAECRYNTTPPGGFYYPPTTPTNGDETPALGTNVPGWGYVGGWDLVEGTLTPVCDGDPTPWQGGGAPTIGSQIPRVAFLANYTGGGMAFNVDNYMYAEEGVMIGDAGWAATGPYPNNTHHGPGTIVAERSVWSDASFLSDYVFDLYYGTPLNPQDAQAAAGYLRTPLEELPNYVERHRHLPTIPGRTAWKEQGTFSVDQLTNNLWVTVEEQALYIKELNARMDALQQYLVEKKLRELEAGE